jgi:hypothetical protein
MNRTKFFQLTTVNSIQEVDMLYNTLSSFNLRHTPAYYKTSIHDVMQPDLISYKLYGTERYWWIICVVNNIQNPLVDIIEGMTLKIPSIFDIQEFYRKYKVR